MHKNILSEQQLIQLIADIKKKKELSSLSSEFVQNQLFSLLSKDHKLLQQLQQNFHSKSAVYRQVVKEVRAILRRVYGLYRGTKDIKKRQDLLDLLKKVPDAKRKEVVRAILKTSASTKERLPFYDKFWKKIFQVTENPETITDIGAGIHPFSIFFSLPKKLTYYAYDLSNDEVLLLQEFFDFLHEKKNFFSGKAEVFDALQFESLRNLPKADLALLLKMTDVLDRGRGHKASEYIISAVPAKWVIVSFPTLTMSGKEMNFPERKWIELMCKRLRYGFEKFMLGKEIFYVVKKF